MIYWYFGTLLVLAALSQIDGVLAIASLLVVPGILLVAANTLLLYSVLLLPFFLRPREMLQKPFMAALAILPALLVAFGIPQLAQSRRDAFIAQQQQQDFDQGRPADKVRTIAFAVARTADLACNDLCERLLYNREVDKVVRAYFDNSALQGTPQTVGYRVEKQATSCERGQGAPGAYSVGSQARRIAGECIVREPDADPDAADAAITEWPLYYTGGLWRDPRDDNDRLLFDLTSIETVSLIAGGLRKGKPLLRRTTVVATAAAMPLHITTTNSAFSPQLMIATNQPPYSGYVLEQVLKQKLGFRLAEVVNP